MFDTTNFRKLWEAAVKAEKLTDVRFHDLRHTAATWQIRNGTPIVVVQKMLGHDNITTTMRYASVSDDEVRSRVQGLPTAIDVPAIEGKDDACARSG